MEISKIDFWQITKASFFDSNKGARITLESIEPVINAIENMKLPLQENSEEPIDDPVEWKKWDALYNDLYNALDSISDSFKMIEKHCRQNNEMWATYESLQERYKRLHDHYGERS